MILGMSLKFVNVLSKIQSYYADGSVSGGPMYYLSRGLKEIGLNRLGKF